MKTKSKKKKSAPKRVPNHLIDRSLDAETHAVHAAFDVLDQHGDHECESMDHLRDALDLVIECWGDIDRVATNSKFKEIVKHEFKKEER